MEDIGPEPLSVGEAPRERAALARTLYWLRDLLLAVIIAVVVILFLYRPV